MILLPLFWNVIHSGILDLPGMYVCVRWWTISVAASKDFMARMDCSRSEGGKGRGTIINEEKGTRQAYQHPGRLYWICWYYDLCEVEFQCTMARMMPNECGSGKMRKLLKVGVAPVLAKGLALKTHRRWVTSAFTTSKAVFYLTYAVFMWDQSAPSTRDTSRTGLI